VRSEDPLGNVTSRAYDEAGNLLCEKRPLGGDPLGRDQAVGLSVADVRARVCAGSYVTQREYDELGKLTRTTDVLGGVFRFVYDEVRNLLARSDAKGNLTTYEYGPRNEHVAEHQHLDAHAVPDRASVPLAEGPVDVDAGRGTLDWAWSARTVRVEESAWMSPPTALPTPKRAAS